jgi:hypothetical protein
MGEQTADVVQTAVANASGKASGILATGGRIHQGLYRRPYQNGMTACWNAKQTVARNLS